MYLHPDMSEIHAIKNVEQSEDCCVYLLDQITVSSLQAYLASQTINSLKLSKSPNTVLYKHLFEYKKIKYKFKLWKARQQTSLEEGYYLFLSWDTKTRAEDTP